MNSWIAPLSMSIAVISFAAPVRAKDYPDQPIKIVVPFAPGGGADLPARLIAKKLTVLWHEPVIVENRTGATGTIAEGYVAKAAPDGYTVLLATPSSHTIGPQTLKNLSFDPLRDLKPVTLFGWVPNVLVVNPSVPANNVQQLIALAKSEPGVLNYSSSGAGSSVQIHTELFSQAVGIKMTHIPYSGVSPAATAVIAGQVQLMFAPAPVALSQVKAGRLKQLNKIAPVTDSTVDYSTMTDPKPPEYASATWLGFLMPAGTPDSIVAKWQSQMASLIKMKDVQAAFAQMSIVPTAKSSSEFDHLIREEYAKDGKLLRQLGLSGN